MRCFTRMHFVLEGWEIVMARSGTSVVKRVVMRTASRDGGDLGGEAMEYCSMLVEPFVSAQHIGCWDFAWYNYCGLVSVSCLCLSDSRLIYIGSCPRLIRCQESAPFAPLGIPLRSLLSPEHTKKMETLTCEPTPLPMTS